LGALIATSFGLPIVITFATATWVFWLQRFRIAVAAVAGAAAGLLSTLSIPLPLWGGSIAAAHFCAAILSALGAGLFGAWVIHGGRKESLDQQRLSSLPWRFSLRDLLARFVVVSVLLTGWTILLTLWRTGIQSGDFNDKLPTVAGGYAAVPQAKQIDDLLGPARHYWANYSARGRVQWFTEAIFAPRYELTMWVDVEYDPATGKILKVDREPKFTLQEIGRIDGNHADFRRSFEFGAEDWQNVVDAKGDFTVIGIKLDQGAPIAGFSAYQALPRNGIQFRGPKSR
jgi:hypothetical protein